LAEEVAAIKRTAYVPLLPGTTYYYTRAIADNVMAPYRIWLTHLDRRLDAVTLSDLDQANERWVDTTGDPWKWFSVSWDMFGVYPRTVTGGGMMRVDYLAWPDTLLDDSHESEFPEPDQDGLILYSVYDGLLKQWDIDRALQTFSLFVDRWGSAKTRSGAKRTAARSYQRRTTVVDNTDTRIF